MIYSIRQIHTYLPQNPKVFWSSKLLGSGSVCHRLFFLYTTQYFSSNTYNKGKKRQQELREGEGSLW